MSNIKKIRQEIEQLRREIDDHNYYLDNSEQALGYSAALDDIEKFLDTLSEEPDKSLEEAATHYSEHTRFHWPNQVKPSYDAFIAGAEWIKSKMMKWLNERYKSTISNVGCYTGHSVWAEVIEKLESL